MSEWKLRTAKTKKASGNKLESLANRAYKAGSKLGSGPRKIIGAAQAFMGGVMGAEKASDNKKSSAAPKKKGDSTVMNRLLKGKKKSPKKDPFSYIKG